VYPLEVQLRLTERKPLALPLPEVLEDASKTDYLIQRIDSLEKTLEDVVRNYLRDTILLPMKEFGETPKEVDDFLNDEMEKGYLEEYRTDNPKIPGRKVKCLRLKRDNPLVTQALLPPERGEAEP